MSGPKAEARVVVSKDGPYIVTGNVPLATQTIVADADGGSELWKQGEPVRTQEKYALCRCGQSKKKPFCDGAHAKIGFDGTETASRESYVDQAKVLDGPSMALMDAEQLCAFGRFCDPHGKVWDQVGRTDDPRCTDHVHPAGRKLSGGSPGGLGQGDRKGPGAPPARFNRSRRRSPGRLQRAALVTRRNCRHFGGWL